MSIPITLTPSSLSFAHPGSPTQSVAISQTGHTGPYTDTQTNSSIASVTVSGTNLIVLPTAPGSTTITVSDGAGNTANIIATVGAAVAGIILSTGSLNLSTGSLLADTGAPAQTFTATRTGDSGPFTAMVSPSGIITLTGSGNAPGPVTYTVVPIQAGTATITVSASDGSSITLPVTVTGTLTASVASTRFQQNLVIAVSELGYSGTITPNFIGATSATITPSVGYGPTASFTITDANPGETFLLQFADANGNIASLSVQSKNLTLGQVALTFFDETGINPAAPSSQYQIYYQGDPQNASTLVASGFLGVGGTATVALDASTDYVVEWIGQQAPTAPTLFTTSVASALSVIVTGYRSPYLSTLGYATQQLSQWTRGWAGDQYKQPGAPGTTGNAYNVAYSFAALLGQGGATLFQRQEIEIPGLDTYLQNINVATRLFNCSGSELDSFFADFLGSTFKRQTGETDGAFLARGLIAINNEVATRKALNDATNAAWQTLGNTGTVVCDDCMSNAPLMAQIGYTQPYFVVLLPVISDISDAFLLDHRYLGLDTYLLPLGTAVLLNLSQVPPLVQQAVESKRALGTIPLYAQFVD